MLRPVYKALARALAKEPLCPLALDSLDPEGPSAQNSFFLALAPNERQRSLRKAFCFLPKQAKPPLCELLGDLAVQQAAREAKSIGK